jgi:hypothetical protein
VNTGHIRFRPSARALTSHFASERDRHHRPEAATAAPALAIINVTSAAPYGGENTS